MLLCLRSGKSQQAVIKKPNIPLLSLGKESKAKENGIGLSDCFILIVVFYNTVSSLNFPLISFNSLNSGFSFVPVFSKR